MDRSRNGAQRQPASRSLSPSASTGNGDAQSHDSRGLSTHLRRLIRLIEAFQSRQRYTSRQLAQLCGVSQRTVFRDLKLLQQAGLAVTQDNPQNGYQLSSNGHGTHPEFTFAEALTLTLLCQQAAEANHSIPGLCDASAAAWKIRQSISPDMQAELDDWLKYISIRQDSPTGVDSKGPLFQLLWRAARDHRNVSLTYRSQFDQLDRKTKLAPYQLLSRRQVWHVIGYSSVDSQVVILDLNVLRDADVLDETFEIPHRFSLKRFLSQVWTANERPQSL